MVRITKAHFIEKARRFYVLFTVTVFQFLQLEQIQAIFQ